MVESTSSTTAAVVLDVDSQAPPGQAQYGRSWVLAAVQARQASGRTQLRPHAELTAYLQSPLEQTEDVVGWWGVSLFFLSLRVHLHQLHTAPSVTISDTFTHGPRLFSHPG